MSERNKSNVENRSGNDYTNSIPVSGLDRTYHVHVSAVYSEGVSAPLVIALHGSSGSGKYMREFTGFNSAADKENFFVVYPDGVGGNWNDGREDMTSRAYRENIDDVSFISELIDALAGDYSVDKNRVYLTGISNGAMMSFRLACEISGKVAAVATVAGSMPVSLMSCSPARPVPVLMMFGTEDTLVPWEGGEVELDGKKLGKVVSVAETVNFWVRHNKCSSLPGIRELWNSDPGDETRVVVEEYSQGDEGSEMILYKISGGGHTWPDGIQYWPESIIGKTSRDINANRVIIDFFRKH